MSATLEGLQKLIDAANVNECAELVYKNSKVEEVDFNWKWEEGNDEGWFSTHILALSSRRALCGRYIE